jgi:exodeoxyribonuclease-5
MNLTKEQEHVVNCIIKDIKKKQEISLGGAAGCGKSVVVTELHRRLPKFGVAAFTGKATHVLRRRGIEKAKTIHSLIYNPISHDNGTVTFELKDHLDVDGFVLDESSTISLELYKDMKSFGLPMVFVGDHNQLEPVGSNPNLMKSPDYRLETIHRNAGEIAHFANWIKEGKRPEEFPAEKKVSVVSNYFRKEVVDNPTIMKSINQAICAFNSTRVGMNAKIRQMYGLTHKLEVGDRVICLKNNRKIGLFNGMQGWVTEVRKGNRFDLATDVGEFEKVSHHPDVWGMEKIPENFNLGGANPFDYAYCITCHKAIGDQWDKVLVLEQVCKHWSHVRWLYTAVSRACEEVVLVTASGRRS